MKISASVGKDGKNHAPDVLLVQRLLNYNLRYLIPYAPLPEDGRLSPATTDLIAEFQRRVLHLMHPDGRVDPNGATFKKLLEGAPRERPAHVEAFINSTLLGAILVKLLWRVPISVLIAQAAIESGWGRHVKGNAYFGIKGKSPSGTSTTFTTSEYVDGDKVTIDDEFRAYKDFSEAADDYGRFLNEQPRYSHCFAYTSNPEKFIDELAKAGYATDPDYARKLKSIIKTYGLDEYDK